VHAVPLGRSSAISIAALSLIGVFSFLWPFVAPADSFLVINSSEAPLLFAIIIPLLLTTVFSQISDGVLNAKAIALLGALAAVIAVLRPLGAGLGGIEPIWVILILAGRALGPGFGFLLGSISLLASAMFTGGVGPWLPFQMLAAAWVGLGAGLLPKANGKWEIFLLSLYAAIACVAFGFVMNLWFWPIALGPDTTLSLVDGGGLADNTVRWLVYSLGSSTLTWDTVRALTTAVTLSLVGRPVLAALRRVYDRSATPKSI